MSAGTESILCDIRDRAQNASIADASLTQADVRLESLRELPSVLKKL